MMASSIYIPKDNHYVLVIEDSPIDYEIIVRTFKRVEFFPAMYHVTDGDQALSFLELAGQVNSQKCLPSLILLDLNIPGTDGREVLTTIKRDPILKKIPVIVLSTSDDTSDVEFSLRHGAEKYLKKPVSTDDFAVAVNVIKTYWETQVIPHGPYF